MFEATHYTFPDASVVWGTRWVEFPFYSFLHEYVVEGLLVPIVNVVQKFFFAGDKVRPIVGPDDGWDAPAGAEPLDSHHAAAGVHTWDHLEVDGPSREAGEKKSPSFFGRSLDRYEKGSKIIDASVGKWGFLER